MANENKNCKSNTRSNRNTRNKGGKKWRPVNDSKGNRNERRAAEVADTAERMVSKSNPVSWYTRFPQFAKDAGTLAFGIPVGQPIQISSADDLEIPGLMSIYFIPTIGVSSDNGSAINRSTLRFYTWLRNVQKAAHKYDPADVMLYFMAMDSCYMFHSFLRRAYGVAQLFSPVNKYLPITLLRTMGIDASVLDNLAEFRAYINRFALQLGMYTVPSDIDITARHRWMCEGVYTDSTTTRAQLYMFCPEGFWKYNNTVTTGSQLDWAQWITVNSDNSLKTRGLDEIRAFGDSLITAIRGDEDTGNISGDIYMAFGGNTMKVVETPDLFTVLPTYDETVLTQIQNATFVGPWASTYTPVISQNPTVNNGAIIFEPQFQGWVGAGENDDARAPILNRSRRLLNIRSDAPTPEQVIEATRLVVGTLDDAYTAGKPVQVTSCGADIATRYRLSGSPLSPTKPFPAQLRTTNGTLTRSAGTVAYSDVFDTFEMQNFDWHPFMYLYRAPINSETEQNVVSVGGDIDNVTVVNGPQLDMMHEAAMLSLFDIPQMGN